MNEDMISDVNKINKNPCVHLYDDTGITKYTFI